MKSNKLNLGECIINGKNSSGVILTITNEFEVGDRVTAISSTMQCTGFVTKIDIESIWLNEIRFPRELCSFLPA